MSPFSLSGPCVIEYQLCRAENDQDGRAEAFEMTKTPLYIVVHGGIETEQGTWKER
jgi:hypothetical protein